MTFQLRRNAKEVVSANRRDIVLQQPGIRYSADTVLDALLADVSRCSNAFSRRT